MAISRTFQIQRYGTPPVEIQSDTPEPLGHEVLLNVSHTGVCHSDVHIMDGYQDLGGGERMNFADSAMPLPLTMGHEIVGTVEAVGDKADQALLGQRRLVFPWIGCGECVSCQGEQDNHCEKPRTLGIFSQGGYGEHVIVPNQKYLIEMDGLDPAWTCTLACSGLTVFSALRQIQPIKPNSYVAIVGMGGLGLMAVSIAVALGIKNIIACDISDDRLAIARELGATAALNTSTPEAEHELAALANGRLFGVIDTVGLPSTIQLAIAATMKGARVVVIGLAGGRIELPLPTLPFNALSLIGTYTGSLDEMQELVELAKTETIPPMPIDLKPLDCLHETLEALRAGEVVGRVVLTP